MAKCWCGKELEYKRGSGPMELRDSWVCPDHGENWRWRPCVFGGPETIIPVGDGPSRYCEARSYGPLNGRPKMHVYVCPEQCVSCPVPVLVDAVLAIETWMITPNRTGTCGRRFISEELAKLIRAAYDALPKKESPNEKEDT